MSILGTEDARGRGRKVAQREAEKLRKEQAANALAAFKTQSIEHLNRKVEKFNEAHVRVFGYAPSAGLTLDFVRAPAKEEEYEAILDQASGTARQNKARLGVVQTPIWEWRETTEFPPREETSLFDEETGILRHQFGPNAITQPGVFIQPGEVGERQLERLAQLAVLSSPEKQAAWIKNEQRREKLGLAKTTLRPGRAFAEADLDAKMQQLKFFTGTDEELEQLRNEIEVIQAVIQAENIEGSLGDRDWMSKQVGHFGDIILSMPFGAWEIGKGVGLDTRDGFSEFMRHSGNGLSWLAHKMMLDKVVPDQIEDELKIAASVALPLIATAHYSPTAPKRDPSFRRTREIGKGMLYSIWEDLNNPIDNFAYLALDVLGAATFAGSGVVRGTTAASRFRKAKTIEGYNKLINASRSPGERGILIAERNDLFFSDPSLGAGKWRAATKGLVRRPRFTATFGPDVETAGLASSQAMVPLLENWMVASIQSRFYKRADDNFKRITAQGGDFGDPNLQTWQTFFNQSAAKRRADIRAFNNELNRAKSPVGELAAMYRGRSKQMRAARKLLKDPKTAASVRKLKDPDKAVLDMALLIRSLDFKDDATAVSWMKRKHEDARMELELQLDDIAEELRLDKLAGEEGNRIITDEARSDLVSRQRNLEDTLESNRLNEDLIDVAVGMLDDKRNRVMTPLVEAARELSLSSEQLKRDFLGLDDRQAVIRIAEARMAFTGELERLLDNRGKRNSLREELEANGNSALITQELSSLLSRRDKVGNLIHVGPNLARPVESLTKAQQKDRKRIQELNSKQSRALELEDQINELEMDIAGLEASQQIINPERAFYVPFQHQHYQAVRRNLAPSQLGQARAGIGPPANIPEMDYSFTGAAIRVGDYAYDTSRLLADQQLRAFKAITVKQEYDILWAMGARADNANINAAQARGTPVFIKRSNSVSEEIRRKTVELERSKVGALDESSGLIRMSDKELQQFSDELFHDQSGFNAAKRSDDFNPDEWRVITENELSQSIGGGERAFEDFARFFEGEVGGPLGRAAGIGLASVNEFGRVAYLFGRPGYAVNALGSFGLSAMQQGPLAFRNYTAALRAQDLWSVTVRADLDALAGTTKAASFIPGKPAAVKTSRWLAEHWQGFTDVIQRRSGVIHELLADDLIKLHYTDEQMRAALAGRWRGTEKGLVPDPKAPINPKMRQRVNLAAERGRRKMVDFNNLNPFERNVLRQLFFVYAWVSRSGVYSLRFLVEHPGVVDTLSRAGEDREAVIEEMFGVVPDWVTNHPYIPISRYWGMQDAIQLQPLFVLNEMASVGGSVFSLLPGGEDPSRPELFEQFVGPLGELGLDIFRAARDQPKGGEFGLGAFAESVVRIARESPPGKAIEAGVEALTGVTIGDPPGRAEDVEGVQIAGGPLAINERAVRPLNSARDLDVPFFQPPFAGDYAPYLFGSTDPVEFVDISRMSSVWRESDPEKKRKVLEGQVELLVKGQEALLDEKAPPGVRESAALASEMVLRWEERRKELGLDPSERILSERELLNTTIEYLKEQGELTPSEEEEIRKEEKEEAGRKGSAAGMRMLRMKLFWDNGGEAWREWNGRATKVHNLATVRLPSMMWNDDIPFSSLRSLTEQQRLEYAKVIVDRGKEMDAIAAEESNTLNRAEEEAHDRRILGQKLEEEKSIVVDGEVLPSAEQYRFYALSDERRQEQLMRWAKRSLGDLTAFEKRQVGFDSIPNSTRAWFEFAERLDSQRRALERNSAMGTDLVPTLTVDDLKVAATAANQAKLHDRDFPGFAEEYKQSKRPRVFLLSRATPILNSQYLPSWNNIFVDAGKFATALEGLRKRREEQDIARAKGEDVPKNIRAKIDISVFSDVTFESQKSVRDAWKVYVDDVIIPALDSKYPAGFRNELKIYGGRNFLRGLV